MTVTTVGSHVLGLSIMTHGGEERPDSFGAGAPDLKIEITPTMLAAGVQALLDSDPRFEDERDTVAAVFRAMTTAGAHPPSEK